jgi:hypothetical protein
MAGSLAGPNGWPFIRLFIALFTLGTCAAFAQLQLLPNTELQRVFAGNGRRITLTWRNPSAETIAVVLRARLHQVSSATTIPLGEAPWKKLDLLPGQTVLESAMLDFPAVRAETRFLIQWVENTNTVAGSTELLVYPTNLLQDLRPLAGDEPIGVFDPQNQLKPLFKALSIECSDLEDNDLENFPGKLAIIGPFQSPAQMREGLAKQVKSLAAKGRGIVWLLPPAGRRENPKPSFYTVLAGKGTVVVVQPALVANLPESPLAQLNLIYFSRLALHPEPLVLPDPAARH